MKTIITKQDNVINCDCGTVIEYDTQDLKLKGEKENLFAIAVECPTCHKVHKVTPKEFNCEANYCKNNPLDNYMFSRRLKMYEILGGYENTDYGILGAKVLFPHSLSNLMGGKQ